VDQIVYLNGEYVPLADAKIPVLDRGFIFGDGVYEVIPAYGRTLFRLREHLARLEHSLRAIRIANPHDAPGWSALLGSVVARNPWEDQSVYLQVTRGVAPRTQEFPKGDVRPTVFVMASPLKMPTAEQRANGVAVVTRDDYRWRRCDIKSVSLLANCLLRQEAEDAGAVETILVRGRRRSLPASRRQAAVQDVVSTWSGLPPECHWWRPACRPWSARCGSGSGRS